MKKIILIFSIFIISCKKDNDINPRYNYVFKSEYSLDTIMIDSYTSINPFPKKIKFVDNDTIRENIYEKDSTYILFDNKVYTYHFYLDKNNERFIVRDNDQSSLGSPFWFYYKGKRYFKIN